MKPIFFLTLASILGAQQLPLEPRHDAGQSITGVFEGWYKNPDGTFSLLFGYYNRNLKESLDIAIGPNNRIEPGGPDRGQPAHFVAGRMWGSFTVAVPADFGTGKLTWTIVANGKSTVIPASLKTDWEISPFLDATNNTPPWISFHDFDHDGPVAQGPRSVTASTEATTGAPFTLDVWAADDNVVSPGTRQPRSPVSVVWTKFRGPGAVTFSTARPEVHKFDGKMPPKATFAGKATTTVTFSEPGEYVLQVMATDASGEGGGGFQCCWTTAHLKVSVKGESATGR
ncbi:MAG: hypothetical protein LAO79_00870 [Acidobacteriia bacterium]|nr:hypothetical protein [Terriglobia bacterium]